MLENRHSTEVLLQELIEHQQTKVLKVAREIVPDATPEDIRNPQDFPDLVADPLFNYEDGIRDCLLSRGLGDVYKRQQLHPELHLFPLSSDLLHNRVSI